MRIALVSILCAIWALATASAQIDTSQPLVPKQTLVPINGFPTTTDEQYQRLLDVLIARSWVEGMPASTGDIEISPSTGLSCASCSGPGIIFEPPSPAFFPAFIHELPLANDMPASMQLAGMDQEIEITTTALSDYLLMAAGKADPNFLSDFSLTPSTVTCAMEMSDFANRRNAVFGGAGNDGYPPDYYANSVFDNDGCALPALFVNANGMGMNFIKLMGALKENPPTSSDQFLSIFDSLVPEIEGVPPSLWLEKNNPVPFCCMRDGRYLGIKESGSTSWFGSSVLNIGSGINPAGFEPVIVDWQLSASGEHVPVGVPDHRVCWSMLDTEGKEIIHPQLSITNDPQPVWLNQQDGQWVNGYWWTPYPTGSYLVPVADTASDLTGCSTDPRLTINWVVTIVDQTTLGSLKPGDLVVSVNGPKWGTLPMKGSYDIQLVSPLGATLTAWPDTVIVQNVPKRSDGSSKEVTLQVTYSDGTVRIRTFQPDWSQPIRRYMVDKDEPTLLTPTVQRATDGEFPPAIAPQDILSIYAKDLTGNAPCEASSFPIPIDGSCGNALNDQGRTQVSFTVTSGSQTGTQLFGRPLYVGTTQINVVVPSGLPTGETVSVTVIVNGTPSFQAMTTVAGATDPGVFMIDAAQHAAVIAATGTNAGKVLGLNGATASAGDILQVFGTGLGQKAIPVPDGAACPGADWAAAPVTATIGGEPAPASYAGCAPGYAGLDQINLTVPAGLASGDQPLIVTAGLISSTPTMLPIQ